MTIEYKDSKRITALSTDFSPTVTTPATYQVTDTSGGETLSGSLRTTSAEAIKSGSVLIGKTVSKVEFPMYKLSSPTGTVTAGVFNSSGSLLYTFGTMEAADISTSTSPYVWYAFENTVSTYTLSQDEYVGVRYSGGNSTNRVVPRHDDDAAPFDGTNSIWSRGYDNGNWQDFTTIDASFKLYLATDGSKPINVQDNSLLVEKDTAIRYWFTAGGEAPTTTSHFEGHGQQPVDVSDTIDIPTTGLSNLSTGSVSFWIYLETESTSAGDYVVISASNDTQASREFALGFVGHVTGVGIICRNGSGICTFTCPNSLTRNAWNHVVYTNNSSGNKVYVNGSQVTPSYSVGSASTNAFFGTVGTNNTCTIGANKDNVSGGYYQWGFDGNLQQLLVYSAVLTQAEITALYNNGKYNSSPSATNLLRRYELTSNANDTSGNGHNGTATAGVTYTSLAVPPTPATWNMQPTFQDDFSTNKGWTNLTSNTSVTTQLNYTETNSTYIRATKDLQDSDALGSGNTMSDNFVLRFELNKTNDATNTGNGSQPLIDISSSLLDAWFNNQDSIGMNITVDRTTTMGYQAIGADNQYTHQGDSAINTYTWVTGIRYCEVIKNATADTVTATIYTNSDYTGSLGTATVSTSGKTFSGLRYLSMRNFADNARSSTVWEMNNVQVYDGVTTIN